MKLVIKRVAFILSSVLLMTFIWATPVAAAADEKKSGPFISVGLSTTASTYYVDGERGNDSADGKSVEHAWKSLNKVSSTVFQPGDHILLESSSTWNNQQLNLQGSGQKDNDIIVDIYAHTDKGPEFTASRRPVINAGGTYGSGTYKRYVSGGVQIVNQEYWQIRHLEVTNTKELNNPEGYKKSADAQRVGILLLGYGQDRQLDSIQVCENYVHDVQSEYYLSAEGDKRLKPVGGIIALGHWYDPDGNQISPSGKTNTGFKNLTIDRNIVQRVGLEGIRTKADLKSGTFNKLFENVRITNNYLEDIAGDAIVASEIASKGLVEGNVVVRASNADYGTQNYAAVWVMASSDVVLQYNEVYGSQYGYNDGEAFDIDMQSTYVTYQYNYSHHNRGGFLLLMSDQANSTIRYNISANDGGGNRGTGKDLNGGGNPYTYKEQSLFHYWVKDDSAANPNIYNNTFYVGDGISTSLYGEGNAGDNSGTIAHFYNNIVVKEGEGRFRFLTAYPANGSEPIERTMNDNPQNYMKNNIFWPESILTEKSGATKEKMEETGNIIADPKLDIETNVSALADLAKQESTVIESPQGRLPWDNVKERIRQRAAHFAISADSPAIAKGMDVQGKPNEDLFGNSTADRVIDIGAYQASNFEVKTEYIPSEVKVDTPAGVYPQLPKSVDVLIRQTGGGTTKEHTETRSVQWNLIEFADYQHAGRIKVEGTLEGIDSVKANAVVTVSGETGDGKLSEQYVADDVSYVQRGKPTQSMGAAPGTVSDAEVTAQNPYGESFSGGYIARLKNSPSADYNRRIYVKYNPSQYSGKADSIKEAKIRLFVTNLSAWSGVGLENTSFRLDVYAVGSNWNRSTLTWNNGPGNADITKYNHPDIDGGFIVPDYKQLQPVANLEIANADIIKNGYCVDIDIAQYLRKQNALDQPISFVVDMPTSAMPTYNRDNSALEIFTLDGAKKAMSEYQAKKFKLPQTTVAGFTMSETALAPQILISDVYITSVDEIPAVEISPGEVPVLAMKTTVHYSNGVDKQVTVDWGNLNAEQFLNDGTYVIQGKADGIDQPIKGTVRVVSKRITGLVELPILDRVSGLSRAELGMPNKVVAHLSDGTDRELRVVGWDDDGRNYSEDSEPSIYYFPGAIELPQGVTNPESFKPIQAVHTHAKPARIEVNLDSRYAFQGQNTRAHAEVTGEGKYSQIDDWGKQVIWSVSQKDNDEDVSGFVSVDEDGNIKVNKNAPVGDYRIEARSRWVENLSQFAVLTVTSRRNITQIRYDANADDAAGAIAPSEVDPDGNFIVAKNTYSRKGYVFAGWNTRSDGKGLACQEGERVNVSNLPQPSSMNEVVLYAQWNREVKPGGPDDGNSQNPGNQLPSTGTAIWSLVALVVCVVMVGVSLVLLKKYNNTDAS